MTMQHPTVATERDEKQAPMLAKARELGTEEGTAAASWVADGNTPEDWYRVTLSMLMEGDPEVYDALPTADLSGEWADGRTPASLFEDATGLDAHAEATFNADAYWQTLEDLCAAYVEAFDAAVTHEVERLCVSHLAEPAYRQAAYEKGWQASKRTRTYDLDAAQVRYERKHGTAYVSDFIAGWCDYAADAPHKYAEVSR